MAVTNWNITYINGKEYLVIDVAQFRIPLEWDPNSNMFIAVAAPTGGLGNFPALVKGDDGESPQIDTTINFTPLEWDDPTPNFASWSELSPNVYQLNLGLKTGQPGPDGLMDILEASDIVGTPNAGDLLVINPSGNGFVYQSQKIGDRYYPATIRNTPSGNPAYTLCAITVPPQRFDWRPNVSGQTIITGTGPDVIVDLFARLNNETGGPICGTALGQAGVNPPTHVLVDGPPYSPEVSDSYDRVPANTAATLYLRAERRSGGNTFTTQASSTRFRVRVEPIPYGM